MFAICPGEVRLVLRDESCVCLQPNGEVVNWTYIGRPASFIALCMNSPLLNSLMATHQPANHKHCPGRKSRLTPTRVCEAGLEPVPSRCSFDISPSEEVPLQDTSKILDKTISLHGISILDMPTRLGTVEDLTLSRPTVVANRARVWLSRGSRISCEGMASADMLRSSDAAKVR